MTEESRQDRRSFFRRDHKNNGHDPKKKAVLGSTPGKDNFCSSEIKHDTRMAQRTELFVSEMKSQEPRPLTRQLSWVRVSASIIFWYSRHVWNGHAYNKLSGNK
jgi:hypothetical protein